MKTKLFLVAFLACCAFILAGCHSNKHDDGKMASLPQPIQKILKQKYPDCTVTSYDKDAAGYEVDITDNNRQREVMFGANNEWLSSKWEMKANEVPPVIMDELTSSQYKDFKIKEIDAIDKPSGMFYVFELNHHNNDVHLTFNSKGQRIR